VLLNGSLNHLLLLVNYMTVIVDFYLHCGMSSCR
jgi:hypothetical protein